MAKMRAKYETYNDRGVNNCVKQSSLPQRLALCVGAMVMMFQKFIVEHKIMNGSVGMVKAIIHESPNGPADKMLWINMLLLILSNQLCQPTNQ